MTGRKKGNKGRERVQVHATLTFQQADQDGLGKRDSPGEDDREREKDRQKGTKVVVGERLSFAEHAIKLLDHMMKEKSVGEVLKLGPREEMLGLTPLSMAAAIGHVEGTRKLLEAGASVEDKSSDGSTALLNAAHWRHLPVLDLLLQHGASVAAVNNEGNNALMVALRHGDVRAVNSLWPHRKHLDINQANNDGYTAIHLAADRKWESCVQFLIQNGADVNKQNNLGQAALHIAASKGDQATSERLLATGASLLLEDHCGNNPYTLAVRGFHDYLAGYFLSKLRPEDKLYFCRRCVHKVQSSLSVESYTAWNAISFLISDSTLRDALYQCDVVTAAVQVLGRRGLMSEVAVQSSLVCCDLMYNPFPIPDQRFVKQFLTAHGPEAALDRLETRGLEHVHSNSSNNPEMSHLQSHVQSQLQTRQQQLDFNTAFILLPVMAMTETPQGRDWFSEATNQQRLAGHLRRLTSYRELLQLVGLVQQEVGSAREARLDRAAIVERFLAFFKMLENKDHEQRVRELLELEEREKSRKEKKREKKRQQRLKQKMKTRVGDVPDDPAAKDGPAAGVDVSKARSKPLDALDDIPLTMGPDGVQDVPSSAAVVLSPGTGQEPPGSEDEWMMVGGKRCYPTKVRAAVPVSCAGNTKELDPLQPHEETPRPTTVHSEATGNSLSEEILDPMFLPSAATADFLDDYSGTLDPGGPRRQILVSEAGSKCQKGGMRWADIARNGNTCIQPEDPGVLSTLQNCPPSMEPPVEERPAVKVTHKTKEAYHEQFPSLNQQPNAEDPSGQQAALNNVQVENKHFDILGAAHQFLEELSNNKSFGASGAQGNTQQASAPMARIDPTILYEALTGWMWQAAVAQGLINPDTDPPVTFPPPDFLAPLANQFAKPKASAIDQTSINENQSMTANSVCRSTSFVSCEGADNKQSMQIPKNESNAIKSQLFPPAVNQGLTNVKDWFDMTDGDKDNFCSHKLQSSSTTPQEHTKVTETLHKNQTAGMGPAAFNSSNTYTLPSIQQSFNTSVSTKDKNWGPETKAGKSVDAPFMWAGNGFTEWLPAYSNSDASDSVFSSRVSGKPVLDSNDLYGLPLTSSTENPKTLEFPVHRQSEQGTVKKTSSQRDNLDGTVTTQQKYPDGSDERLRDGNPFDAATDRLKQFPLSGNMQPKAGIEQKDVYPWFFDDCAKLKIKTAIVSVPRSSDSETTQSSLTEQRSELIPNDSPSLTPDTSRSNCVNSYDSFHQLSSSTSNASSFNGLHECLAPGFLRAATGDVHACSFGAAEDAPEPEQFIASNIFRPAVTSMGLLPVPTRSTEGILQRSFDRQYPDLSTVPEREQSRCFPTNLPKASQVVGHGRPRRTTESKDVDVSSFTFRAPGTLFNGNLNLMRAVGDNTVATATSDNLASSLEQAFAQPPRPLPAERPESPDVLFPESLRDEDAGERSKPVDVFPSIHDMNERDLFQDVFSNSYFLEQIAIDQIRRRMRAMGGGEELLRNNSILFHDLDYYASLYGVRLRDILGPVADVKRSRPEKLAPKKSVDQSVPAWKALVKELGRKMNSKEDLTEANADLDLPSDSDDPAISDWPWSCKMSPPTIVTGGDEEGEEGWWQEGGGSRRWRTWLRQILDMPWTMRRQYGKIVMPARSMEFDISRTGRHPLILGFLTDGTEVGVLALDRTRQALDTRLMATVAADSEPDVHFVLRYKAVWECAGRVYLAMELCDYTLDEYVGIVRLDHRQDPLSANRLAWQLLKGLKYLHSNFAVPHGNLMPGWIFVDSDGRLRLAGYGLRDVIATTRSSNRDVSDRRSIEGDARYWRATEHVLSSSSEPSFQADIQVAGMLLHYILTGGRHPYGDTGPEVEANLKRNGLRQQRVSQEADHLVSLMTVSDPLARPTVDTCLKHPFFWSGEKRFRLVLIVGSDILTEMKTGIPLTGAGSSSMVDILNVVHINTISDNWLSEVDPVLVKEMRAFRQYKNNLPELVLFVYNCCLHFDKMSTVAKEVLDDPCKYFQSRFPGLFMAVYRAMRASDRTDRTCYKPFF